MMRNRNTAGFFFLEGWDHICIERTGNSGRRNRMSTMSYTLSHEHSVPLEAGGRGGGNHGELLRAAV